MTRIIAERTSHLAPGTLFRGRFTVVDGVRTSTTAIIRRASGIIMGLLRARRHLAHGRRSTALPICRLRHTP
jgi:hypothetical protein